MKGIGRNIFFWGYYIERMFFSIIAVTVAVFALSMLTTGAINIDEVSQQLPQYTMLMTLLVVLMNALNSICQNFPITISLGSTRRTSYVAMQMMQHIIVIQGVILCTTMYAVFLPETLTLIKENVLVLVFVFSLIMVLSNIISVISIKFGRGKAIAVYAIIWLLSMGVVMFTNIFTNEILLGYINKLNHPIFFAIGLISDAILIWIGYRAIRFGDVRI